MTTSSVSHLGTNPNMDIEGMTVIQQSCCSKVIDAIKMVFQKIVDFLILIWYGIQHALSYLTSIDPFTRRRVFNENIICTTTNHAKLSDLPKYVEARRDPYEILPKALDKASEHGFTSNTTTLKPKPYSGGHCFGNVTCFLRLWLETKDIEKVKAEFKGGSPFMGAVYQHAYENMYESIYYPEVVEWIDTFLHAYPIVSMPDEKEKWLQSTFKNATVIVDALEAYLREGKHPKEGGFTDYIVNWVKIHRGKNIRGKYLASLREVDEKYEDSELREKARMRVAFANTGLRVEKFYHINSSPTNVLNALTDLEPGAYKLALPKYDVFGKKDGNHALGLAIDVSGTCYILDSNYVIGWSSKEELQKTMGRLFTEYTGFDYSETPEGVRPKFSKRVQNFFRECSNPPSSPPLSGCDLIKVY